MKNLNFDKNTDLFIKNCLEFTQRISGSRRQKRCERFLEQNQWSDYCDDHLDTFMLFTELVKDALQVSLFGEGLPITTYLNTYIENFDKTLEQFTFEISDYKYTHYTIQLDYITSRLLSELLIHQEVSSIQDLSTLYKTFWELGADGYFSSETDFEKYKASEFIHLFLMGNFHEIDKQFIDTFNFDLFKYENVNRNKIKDIYMLMKTVTGADEESISYGSEIYTELAVLQYFLWKVNDEINSLSDLTEAVLLCSLYLKASNKEINIENLQVLFDVKRIVTKFNEQTTLLN